MPGRLQDRDQPAHRVADQDHRTVGHLPQKPVQHLLVGGDRGRVRASLGVTETNQVKGQNPAGVCQQRGERGPVDQRPAQPVHHHQQWTARGTTVVDVVDWDPQIYPPRSRGTIPPNMLRRRPHSRRPLVWDSFAAHPPTVTVVLLNPRSAAQDRLPGSRVAIVLPLMTLTLSYTGCPWIRLRNVYRVSEVRSQLWPYTAMSKAYGWPASSPGSSPVFATMKWLMVPPPVKVPTPTRLPSSSSLCR